MEVRNSDGQRVTSRTMAVWARALTLMVILTLGALGWAPGLASPLAVTPAASLNVPATTMIGEGFSFAVTFDNTGTGAEVGYGPYVDLFLPIGGADGTSPSGTGTNDGVSFGSATYLGAAVNTAIQTCAPNGTLTHPMTSLSVTCPPLPAGFHSSFTWQFVNLELPFGSFPADQPPAAITVNANLSNRADLGTALPIQARGGFRYGADPLDNPATDPPIIQASPASASVTPTLIRLTKTYHGPEDETATGPNFPREYTVAVDIASGQTVTNLDITDYLPGNLQFVQVVSASPAATCGALPSTTTPGGNLVCTFASVTGAAGASDATVRFRFYAPLNDADGNPVLHASTGDDAQCINHAAALGDWTPIDTRDAGGADNAAAGGSGAPPEHILGCKSIAIQKSVANLTDSVNSPGDVLEYTLNFQVSDFFAFQNVVVDDLLSDGQRLQSSFASTLQVSGNGFTLGAAGMAAGNVAVVCNYTGGPGAECDSDDGPPYDGTTAIAFDISAELVTRGRPDGKLLGGCVPAAGGSDYDCDPFNDGATTATVKFRTVIQDQYSDYYPSGDPSMDQGDRLDNDVTITGAVLHNANLTPTGNNEADASAAGLNIAQGSLAKTIYAQNGTACPTQPCTNVQATPGDTITYRLRYTHPTSDFENFSIEDFLPLPVFSATEVASFSNTVCGVPTAGIACLGPADTYHTLGSAVTPTMATNAANNTVKFTYGTYDNAASTPGVVDLLFTVTIEADPFADGLYLTNQARSTEGTTQSIVRAVDAIVQIQLLEPVLGIRKGAIATDKAGATFNPTGRVPANVTVSAPGSACPRLSGAGLPVTSSNLGATFASDVSGVDAGDLVTFAIVVENSGRAPNGAFDVRIKDNLPAGFVAPSGGINLCATDGAGALFTVANVGGGSGLLDQGIELVDPGPTNPTPPGALDRGKLADGAVVADGRNIAIVTFDLQVASTAQPGANIDNTATLTNFAGQEGGPDFTTVDKTDTARTTIATGARTKYLVATSEPSTGAEGGTTRVAIGEIVRYRMVWQLPEGTATNAQFRDNLPPGLTYLDDGTAKMAFVSNGAGFTSASVGTLPVPAIPGGCTVAGATADATTPATLPCTLADANVGSSNSTSDDPDSYSTSGTDPFFKFGTLTNDDRDADSEWIVVEFNALVDNTTAGSNDYNDQLGNTFVPQVNTSSVGSNSGAVNVRVSEPCIGALAGTTCTSNLNKVVQTAPNPADAGGVVAYRVTYANAANPGSPGASANIFATAFDVRMLDTLPAGVQLNLGSVAVTLGGGASGATNSSASNTVDVTVLTIPPGGAVQIDYTATILDSALAGATVDNTANLTYSSLPGANGTCPNATGSCNTGAQGTGTGERTGSGTAPNDYRGSDPASFTIPAPAIDKLAPNPASYTIGEVVTYNILVTLPEGTSQNLVVVDDLPAGLEYIAGSVQVLTSDALLAADFNGALPAYTVTAPGGSGGDVTVAFGSTPSHPLATGDNVAANNAFLVRVQARVLNVAGNQIGATLTNNAAVRYTDPEAGVTTIADVTPPVITIVEPVLQVDKSVATAAPQPDAGDTATYTVVIAHDPTSGAPAYDVLFLDTLPASLENVMLVSVTAAGIAPPGGDVAGNTVRVPASGTFDLPPGATVTIVFTARIKDSALLGQTIDNVGGVVWSTLDGADPNERWDGVGQPDGNDLLNGGALNDYEKTDNASLTTSGSATIGKALASTSAGHTAGSDVTIGEVVTYRLTVAIAEGSVAGLTIVDAVPAGLAYVGGSLVVDAAGFGGVLPTPTVTPAGNGVNGEDVQISFGAFTNPGDNNPANNSFTLALQALVLDMPGNVGVAPQTVLTNSATVQATGGGPPQASNAVAVMVVEPRLQVSKSVTPAEAAANDTVTVVIVVANTGTSTAFAAALVDALPAGLLFDGGLSHTAGLPPDSGSLQEAGGVISAAWAQFPAGQSSTIQFQARLASTVVFDSLIVNAATVSNASTLPGTDPNERIEPPSAGSDDVRVIAPDMRILKDDQDVEFLPGDTFIYDLEISNIGARDATGVEVVDTVSAHTRFDAANSSAGWTNVATSTPCLTNDPPGTTCRLAIGSVAAGATEVRQFAVKVDSPLPPSVATITNMARVDDDATHGADPNPANNQDNDVNTNVIAEIGNRVWLDVNGNGLQDSGEPGLADVTVRLYRSGGVLHDQTVTGPGGVYDFLAPPGDYYVQFDLPTGYQFTVPDNTAGPDGDAGDSDAAPATGRTATTTLAAGEIDLTWDAGLYQPVTVGDFAWIDTDNNGFYEPETEVALSAVQIEVRNSSGVLVATVTTGVGFPTGAYLVGDLPPGVYTAQVVSYPPNVSPLAGLSKTSVFLNSGQSDLSLDFRFAATTAVSVVSLWARQQAAPPVVTLAWQTAAEAGNAGFHVERAASAAGPFSRLTAAPLPSQAVNGGGAVYRWIDRSIQPGIVYWYRLVTVPDGAAIGPVQAQISGGLIFLPLLVHD